MRDDELLAMFLESVPSEYPKHMFCYFANNAARGNVLPFTKSLFEVLKVVDAASPGYAKGTITRIGAIEGTGESQYGSLLQILAELYVTGGMVQQADRAGNKVHFSHEPSTKGGKNPELEVRIGGQWCAVEVKAPRLIEHGRLRATNPYQVGVRLPDKPFDSLKPTPPRDNPVKDFLMSAEEKFAAYESVRSGAFRILVIVWDDFCNEPIAALKSPDSGLLTDKSFNKDPNDSPVRYPHVDGIIVIRHQHQIIRATRCEPLIDGVSDPLVYQHEGFPPKAFIEVPGSRTVPGSIFDALNATPLAECMGAEYQPVEFIMWVGG